MRHSEIWMSEMENAARTMGASEWKVFRTITLPLAWPGLLAGLVLSFARGLGEFGATLMMAGYIPGKTDTIPMAIYFAVESGQTGKATFWVVIIVALGFSTIMWLNWWSQRNMRRFTDRIIEVIVMLDVNIHKQLSHYSWMWI